MNKETIHLIKGYLGYGIECVYKYKNTFGNQDNEEIKHFKLEKAIHNLFRYDYPNYTNIEYIKPILRPINDLTDEEIKQLWYEMPIHLDILNYNRNRTLSHLFDNIQNLDYRTMEYLNSIHIDYFGLIGQGLAIRKESK
jgi:hypothetical protein